ncbi:MAG: membrane protein insertion efficiency factor YidD [bacterium]
MVIPNLNHLLGDLAVGIIGLYQRTLSPDHGWMKNYWQHGFCRFYPTCSEYARQAIITHGFGKGMLLAAKRVSQCHPWSDPRVNNPPDKKHV